MYLIFHTGNVKLQGLFYRAWDQEIWGQFIIFIICLYKTINQHY